MLYMKTTKPELEVPDQALHVAVHDQPETDGGLVRYCRAIATPVVVAELRAQAALIDITERGAYSSGELWLEHASRELAAIATPVVVAELRAQAALIRRSAKYGPSDAWMTHKLDRRADELEAGA